jgi:hypothetical protein
MPMPVMQLRQPSPHKPCSRPGLKFEKRRAGVEQLLEALAGHHLALRRGLDIPGWTS